MLYYALSTYEFLGPDRIQWIIKGALEGKNQ